MSSICSSTRHRGLKTLQPGRHPETCRGPCQSFVNERQTTQTTTTMACNDAAHGQAQGRDELQPAVVQSLDSFIHEVRLLLLLLCFLCVCVCVFVISPRNKIVCKPGRVLFIAIVVACCRSSCCSCCLCCCCCLKVCVFDSFRGVFLPALPRDLVVAADIVAFPAWQSVKTLSKSSSRADWSRSTSASQSQSQTQTQTQSQSQTQDRASKDVN